MSELLNELELERQAELRQALRALLERPLLGQAEAAEAFRLVRKHEDELRRRATELLGYQLAVRIDHARLFRRAWRHDDSRGAAVPSKTLPRDRWQPFTPRHYVVLYLVLSLLEERHSLVQLPLTELAELVCQLGVDLGAPIDFDQRSERKLFVEVLRWLTDWGVIRVSDGETQDDYVDRGREGDCLLTVNQGRLGSLTSAQRPLTEIGGSAELIDEGEYPPTEEGRRSRVRHRLARRLVEDPVVYVNELDDEERAYFLAQRPTNLTRSIEDATGLRAEHRAEGTAFVDPWRKLTDTRFPGRGIDRQLALLLCPFLAAELEAGRAEVSASSLRAAVRELYERHRAHWTVDPDDLDAVEHAAGAALRLLVRMRLVEQTPAGLRALPAVHRYRSPSVRTTRKEQS